MTVYDLGDPVVRTLTVQVGGVLTDPSTIAFVYRAPDGTETPLTPARDGLGAFRVTFTPTVQGTYLYRWTTTGAGAGVESGSVTVLPAFSVPTVADLRAHLNNSKAGDEQELKAKLAAAIAVVERAIGPILPQTFTEKVTGTVLRRRPVQAVTLVNAVAPASTVTFDGDAGLIYGLPMIGATVTYTAGWGPRPDILEAVLIVAARLWETQRSAATGPLGVDPDGNPISTGGLPLLPPRAQALLAPYSSSVGIA